MKNKDICISARWVLPISPETSVLENHSLVVRDGRILSLLPTKDAYAQYPDIEQLNLPDHVLMPGLINAHAHTPMNLFRGLADDLNLMDWLQHHIWPAEGELINEASVEIGSALAMAEMLRSGTTCFNDHYMFPNVTAEVAKKIGMRAALGLLMMDVPTKWANDGAEAFKKCIKMYESTPSHPLITWVLAPHAPYTTSDDTFKKIQEFNQDAHCRVHIHLQETQHEVEESLKQHGMRPVARLEKLGLLTPDLIAVHMVAVDNNDLARIRDTKIQIVHCPESNLKLASGFARTHDFLQAGLNVAIGTDGAASNNNLDMFGEMQTAALLAKAQSQNPTALPADQALKMATLNGAKALGIDHEVGSLEPGKAADMIAIDLSAYTTQPLYNPLSHLVYAVNALQVSHAWVAGKCLLKEGQLTTIDTDHLLESARPLVEKARRYTH